jgi:S1-C subfamily serine protease
MKKFILFSLIMQLIAASSLGQKLDGYKYVVVGTLTYQNGGTDIFGISSTLRRNFENKGFIVLSEDFANWTNEAKQNPCLVLICSPYNNGGSTVGLTIKNCKNEILIEEKSTAANWVNDYADNYARALKNCWNRIDKYSYTFNPTKTPELEFPKVEKTNETEETIKNYLTSNKIDPIEGIYKSYQSDQLSYYKFGIIKQGDKYKAIILESDLAQWKLGEVKAVFEPSSMKGFYSVKWYMGNKTPYETFGNMDNAALLTIELKDTKTGDKTQDKFVKMFPATDDVTFKKDNSKASGSGFFITTSGIIATNAHVIEGASNIEVTVSNEAGNFTYKTKILLSDNKNDVALLQIDDEKFKGLSSIPYGIVENSDVGSKVFTIGYPLNDVMGSNYKVTDGIISSKSGIADDVRYYQISVPLQPGNSGGPLFNKDGNIIGITSARLNSQAVGTQIENVNYAIKSSYLLNLYNMLPNSTKISETSQVASKELQDQVKVLRNYVCLIKVF